MTYLLLLLLLPAQATPDALFTEGNARYEAGDYAGARAAYAQVLGEGHASPALYLNLANTYFRLDSLGQSVRYLEKARALDPGDLRVQHNLQIVRARLDLAEGSVPPPYWETGAAWLHRNASPLLLFGLGAALFLAALALTAWRVWTDSRSPWVRRGLLVLLPPALLLVALAFAVSAGAGVVKRVVVLRPVMLEASGDGTGELLPQGHVLRVAGREDGRMEVVLPDGTRGWIPAGATGDI